MRFDSSYYNEVCDWWKKHNHPQIAEQSLSPYGFVCLNDAKMPVAVSFVYFMAGCTMAQIAWTTTNPNARLKDRYTGVMLCLNGLTELAKQENRKDIICFSSSPGLTRKVKSLGFNIGKTHDLLAGKFYED